MTSVLILDSIFQLYAFIFWVYWCVKHYQVNAGSILYSFIQRTAVCLKQTHSGKCSTAPVIPMALFPPPVCFCCTISSNSKHKRAYVCMPPRTPLDFLLSPSPAHNIENRCHKNMMRPHWKRSLQLSVWTRGLTEGRQRRFEFSQGTLNDRITLCRMVLIVCG